MRRSRKLINRLFVDPTNNIFIQLLRYGFVGGVAFLADYGALYLLTDAIGLHHLLSAAIAFIIGLTVNYLLSISWVFRGNRKSNNALKEFIVFAIIGVIGLGLNELIIWAGTDLIGLHYMLSKLISTAIVFFWNFFARRMTLFTKTN